MPVTHVWPCIIAFGWERMNNKVWEAWAIQQNYWWVVGQVFMFNNHIKAYCSMGVSVSSKMWNGM